MPELEVNVKPGLCFLRRLSKVSGAEFSGQHGLKRNSEWGTMLAMRRACVCVREVAYRWGQEKHSSWT